METHIVRMRSLSCALGRTLCAVSDSCAKAGVHSPVNVGVAAPSYKGFIDSLIASIDELDDVVLIPAHHAQSCDAVVINTEGTDSIVRFIYIDSTREDWERFSSLALCTAIVHTSCSPEMRDMFQCRVGRSPGYAEYKDFKYPPIYELWDTPINMKAGKAADAHE